MPTRDWVEGISAGATLILITLGGLFVVLRRFLKSWREFRAEMRAGVEATKEQATTAATAAVKVDDSMHKTNGGQNVKDALVRIERDLGGIKHTLRTLADADVQLHQRVADLERGPKGGQRTGSSGPLPTHMGRPAAP